MSPWSKLRRSGLFRAQRHDRVDAGRAPGRQIAGEQRDRRRAPRDAGEGGRIGRRHVEQHLVIVCDSNRPKTRPAATPAATSSMA